MKRLFSFICATTVACSLTFAQYEIPNSDFEEWETVSVSGTSGEEPLHWSSFINASGKFASTVRAVQLYKDTEVRPNSTGQYSAHITCRKVLGSIMAQGNMTTGQINGGSMTASDATGNYNWTNTSNSDFNCPFTGRPDTLKVWIRFNSGNGSTGKISAYLHGNGYYQDPNTAGDLSELMAKAHTNPTSNQTWTLYSIPFEYFSSNTPSYALVSFSTNSTPGSGTTSDYMYIDDLSLVYNSEIAAATYKGLPFTFDKDNHANLDELYLDKFLRLTSNGAGASIEKEFDEETFLMTITVKGNNINEEPTNTHTYTIQFTGTASGNDDEHDAIIIPETTIEPSAPQAGYFYLRNVWNGLFLNCDDNTTEEPYAWIVKDNGDTPAIYDEEGHYIRVWRSGTGLNYTCSASTRNTDAATVQLYQVENGYRLGNNLQTSLFGWTDRYLAVDEASHIYNGAADAGDATIWQFIDAHKADRIDYFWPAVEKASLTNGIDATDWITNSKCNHLGGWNDASLPTIQDGVGEQFNTSYDMYQTLQGLPFGIYELEVQGFYRDAEVATAEGVQHAVLYANSTEVPLASIISEAQPEAVTESDTNDNGTGNYVPQRTFGAATWFEQGYYPNTTGKFYLPSMTDLTIGIRKSEEITNDWTCFDNWHLTYYGRLDFSLDYSTYGGKSLKGITTLDETYDPSQLDVTLGNGAEQYEISYDEKTFVLSVIISGYGRTRINEIQFADPMRGINNPQSSALSSQPSALYDLSGRQITTPIAKGIYIREGKKVVSFK